MQRAVITLIVESDGEKFMPDASDIYTKALEKIQAGHYTTDIHPEPVDTNKS